MDQETGPPPVAAPDPGPIAGSPVALAAATASTPAEPACNTHFLPTAVLAATSHAPITSPSGSSCQQPHDCLDSSAFLSQQSADHWTDIAASVELPPSPKLESQSLSQIPEMTTAINVDNQRDGARCADAVDKLDTMKDSIVGQQRNASTDCPQDEKLDRIIASSSYRTPLASLPQLHPQDPAGHSTSPASAPLPHYLPPPSPPPPLPSLPAVFPHVSLADLAHLIRSQGCQQSRYRDARIRHYRSLVSVGLSARLINSGELASRELADYLRSDGRSLFDNPGGVMRDGKDFASLFNTIHDIRDSCDLYRRYSLLDPELGFAGYQGKAGTAKEIPRSFTTFMDEIPGRARDDFLDLISELRTNPDFLANRIASLDQQELASLSTLGSATDSLDFVTSSRGRTFKSAQGLQHQQQQGKSQVSTPVERFLSFERHDPLSALVHTIFACSSDLDATENLRRTDIWATTCARLVREGKAGSNRLVFSILDIWSTMQDWSSKSAVEFHLMEVLQKGQFLIDRLEESHTNFSGNSGQQTGHSIYSANDSATADGFYAWAVERLFEVIGEDQDTAGIPRGALDIGTKILSKLDNKKQQVTAVSLIIRRWFISTFLFNVIKYPEARGIMLGTYIGEKARQKVLGEIAIRVQRYGLEINYNWSQPSLSFSNVQARIDSIIAHFYEWPQSTNSIFTQTYPKPSDSASGEQRFLVVCPSDLITIIKVLFPERRPMPSSFENAIEVSSIGSTATSISGTTVPFRMISDGSSVLSLSASSATSDTVFREPVFDCSSPGNRSSWTDEDCQSDTSKVQSMEQWGRRLRSACSDMARAIGVDACAGSCHPCAERWAVLYVSPDGEHLTTRVQGVSSGEDAISKGSDLSQGGLDHKKADTKAKEPGDDHGSLRDTITKLLMSYDLPSEIGYNEERSYGCRPSGLLRSTKSSYHVRPNAEAQDPFSTNSTLDNNFDSLSYITLNGEQNSSHRSIHRSRSTITVSPADNVSQEGPSGLVKMFKAAIQECEIRFDYLSAHRYHKAFNQFQKLITPSSTHHDYNSLLAELAQGPRELLDMTANAIEIFSKWFATTKETQDYINKQVSKMMHGAKLLRDKMWYMADVRHSRFYEDTRNVVRALKIMGQPASNVDRLSTLSSTHEQKAFRSSDTRFLARAEAQHVSLLAAPVQLGGPRKLSDEQSDITYRWLTEHDIENFCKGEERIHRFCLEINKCVNKLLGDGILEGPVLWSSELYSREKEIFDRGLQNSLLGVPQVEIFNPGLEEEQHHAQSNQSRAFSLDLSSRAHLNNVKTNLGQDSSQQRPIQNIGFQGKLSEPKDIFSNLTPSFPNATIGTLWSPIPVHSNKRTLTNTNTQRPRTATASSSSIASSTRPQRSTANSSEEKRLFLRDLNSVVTGLLLSDFGTITFPHGSETDHWFSGEIGQVCLKRKEAKERGLLVQKSSWTSPSEVSNDGESLKLGIPNSIDQPGHKKTSYDVEDHSIRTSATDSSVSAPLNHLPNNHALSRAGMPDSLPQSDFRYHHAFRRLLCNFAIHSNPFSKLRILHELERLIIASLTSSNDNKFTRPYAPNKIALRNLESVPFNAETVAKEQTTTRNTNQATSFSAHPLHDKYQNAPGSIATNKIVDVYLNLFRDPFIRPKQLFRDLQYIASFVSADTLDKTRSGQALWNAGLAALSLKQDICQMMVELADDIVAFNTQQRNATLKAAAANSKEEKKQDGDERSAVTEPTSTAVHHNRQVPRDPTDLSDLTYRSKVQNSGTFADASPLGTASLLPPHNHNNNMASLKSTTPNESNFNVDVGLSSSGSAPRSSDRPSTETPSVSPISLSQYTMADAAAMLLITAKEGDAVAERELATFYLSEPDLLPIAIAPLTRPRDVFKADLIASVSAGSNSSTASVGAGRTGSIGNSNIIGNLTGGDGIAGNGRNDIFGASGRASGGGKSRVGGGGGGNSLGGGIGNQGATDKKARSDPVTMCIAQHWMELSARGGDQLARTYLRAKDEMERIRSA